MLMVFVLKQQTTLIFFTKNLQRLVLIQLFITVY